MLTQALQSLLFSSAYYVATSLSIKFIWNILGEGTEEMTQLVKRLACKHEVCSQTDLTSHPSCGASGKEGTCRGKWLGIVATLWVPDAVGKPISKIMWHPKKIYSINLWPPHLLTQVTTHVYPHARAHMNTYTSNTHTQSKKEKKMREKIIHIFVAQREIW